MKAKLVKESISEVPDKLEKAESIAETLYTAINGDDVEFDGLSPEELENLAAYLDLNGIDELEQLSDPDYVMSADDEQINQWYEMLETEGFI